LRSFPSPPPIGLRFTSPRLFLQESDTPTDPPPRTELRWLLLVRFSGLGCGERWLYLSSNGPGARAPTREREREQLKNLRKHHEEEISHHKKEIERLQKEIERHKYKIKNLEDDD
uniref:ATP synthase inhibitory factor subunit 1 n=1 Tax=Pseudonaja textilis TaxID=8673 RepID=A0A670YRC9_PSETE